MKKQNLIAIASLAMLLAGCGGNSDTTKTSTSTAPTSTSTKTSTSTSTSTSTKPVTPDTPTLPTELTDDDFGYLSTEDLTYTATSTVGSSLSGTKMESVTKKSEIKLGDGLHKDEGSVTYSTMNDNYTYDTETAVVNEGFWEADDGFVHTTSDPDLNNQVKETTGSIAYDTYFKNPFDSTDELDAIVAEDFEYNSRKSKKNTYSTFVLDSDKLEDEDIAAFLLLVDYFTNATSMPLSYYYYNMTYNYTGTATVLSSSDVSIDHVYLYADANGIIGIDYSISTSFSFTYSGYSYEFTLSSEANLLAKDVDNTGLTLADVKKVPYTKTAGADAQYTAFDNAITSFKAATNYTLSGVISEGKTKVAGFDLAFVTDEYSAKSYDYNSLGTSIDDSTVSYSGVHKVSDGVYDTYSSKTTAVEKGSGHTTAVTMPTLAFSTAIFEYDATNSTADDYVFTLRSSYSSSDVLKLVSNLLSVSTDGDLSVTVSKDGVLKNVTVSYKASSSANTSLTSTYTAVFSFSNINTTTALLTTFENYVAYKTPSTYAELDSYTYNFDTSKAISDTNVEALLKQIFGETTYAKLPNILTMADNLGDYYYVSGISTSSSMVQIQFLLDSSTDVLTTIATLNAALTAVGYTCTGNSYYFSASGDGFNLIAGMAQSNNSILLVQFSVPSSTSTTSL